MVPVSRLALHNAFALRNLRCSCRSKVVASIQVKLVQHTLLTVTCILPPLQNLLVLP